MSEINLSPCFGIGVAVSKKAPPLPGCLQMGLEFLMKSRFCKNNLPLRGRYLGQVEYKFACLMQINEH